MAIPRSEVPHLDAGGALSLTKSTSIIQGVFNIPSLSTSFPVTQRHDFLTLTPTLNSPPRVSIIVEHETANKKTVILLFPS